jgi:hypothetical protein
MGGVGLTWGDDMNASRLKEILELLLRQEKEFNIQARMGEVSAALQGMVSAPPQQQAQLQTNFVQALANFRAQMDKMREQFQPAQIKLFDEIGASEFFSDDIGEEIAGWVRQNAGTLVVAHQSLQKLQSERQNFLTQITQTAQGLTKLGVKVYDLKPGEAEIGFLIPREIFENHLTPLIKELATVNRIIRAFSEAATGKVEPVEVRQISTTDPLFFFGINALTIAAIGGAVTWALNTWKQVEEIRKLRSGADKIEAFTPDEKEAFFGTKIKETIALETSKQTEKILAALPQDDGRRHEQKKAIEGALTSILARVERGMTVEIRLIPPPPTAAAKGQPPTVPPVFQDLQQIIPNLVFPKPEGTPVLELSPPEPKEDNKAAKKS